MSNEDVFVWEVFYHNNQLNKASDWSSGNHVDTVNLHSWFIIITSALKVLLGLPFSPTFLVFLFGPAKSNILLLAADSWKSMVQGKKLE